MARQDGMPRHGDPPELEPRPPPPPAPDPARGATVAQLQRDIDSGATGDKVPALDPAIAPLGTDDEAAGAPPAPQLVAAVRTRERATPPPKGPADPTGQPYGGRGGLRLSLALLALVGLGAAALWLSLG